MKKTKTRAKTKAKIKPLETQLQPEIVIYDLPSSLTDKLKGLLWDTWQSLSQLENELAQGQALSDKMSKNLIRSLEHNSCFIEQEGKWGIDKRGQEINDPVYQWLCTVMSPLTYQELKSMAKDNGVIIGKEKDLVCDSRFIRLKTGRWALSGWRLTVLPKVKALKALLKDIEAKGMPISIEAAHQFLGLEIELEALYNALDQLGLFVRIKPGFLYSKNLFSKLQSKLQEEDSLELFRQAEINVLQEAELMLIIRDNSPHKRRYILSSRDLETGKLSLSKRIEKIFRDFPEVCYLNFNLKGKTTGVWYFEEYHTLFGLKEWYEENGLEPGHILELGWSEGQCLPNFELTITGEREAEVYSEGSRVTKLSSFCLRAKREQLELERALFGIMELFPSGLSLDYIQQALQMMGLSGKNLEAILHAYPFFEEQNINIWRCNLAMKNSYFDFLTQIKYAHQELESAKKEVASSLAEVRVLQAEKETIYEELTYLQKLHREEQALYQEKISDLAVQNEHYQIDIANLRSEVARLQEREAELMEEIHTLGEQLIILRKDKNKFKVKSEQLENKLVQVQGNLTRTLEEAETEIIRLKKLVVEKTSELESIQYANGELQKNLARLHEERREMRRKLSSWPLRLILSIFGFGNYKDRAVSG